MPKLDDMMGIAALFAAFVCGAAMGGFVKPGDVTRVAGISSCDHALVQPAKLETGAKQNHGDGCKRVAQAP